MYIRENNEKRDANSYDDKPSYVAPPQPERKPRKGGEMSRAQPTRKSELVAENVRLRAELEALKPKPVVTTQYGHVVSILSGDYYPMFDALRFDDCNLKLTFSDGVLVSAEVIK